MQFRINSAIIANLVYKNHFLNNKFRFNWTVDEHAVAGQIISKRIELYMDISQVGDRSYATADEPLTEQVVSSSIDDSQ